MRLRSFLFALLLLVAASPVAAQMLPFGLAIEARAGLATPTGEFSDSDDQLSVESGTSYAIGGRITPFSSVGIFAGYQMSSFDCEQCGNIGIDDSVKLEGLEAGVSVGLPLMALPVSPWVRAGVIYQKLVFSGFEGELGSDPALGFTGGLGVSIPVLGLIEIMPAVRYLSVPVEYDFEVLRGGTEDVSAFTADLGIALTF